MIFEVVKPKRHPFRGAFFGLIFGFGLAEFGFNYGILLFGKYTPFILLAIGIVLGVAVGIMGPVRGKKKAAKPPAAAPPAAPSTPATPTA
jgi:hypothetical protein